VRVGESAEIRAPIRPSRIGRGSLDLRNQYHHSERQRIATIKEVVRDVVQALVNNCSEARMRSTRADDDHWTRLRSADLRESVGQKSSQRERTSSDHKDHDDD